MPRRLGWAQAAALTVLVACLLVSLDAFRWHPGFAIGDETDVFSFLQRFHEGMPWRWIISNGSLHKSLLQALMLAWPGSMHVAALPGLLALPLEAALLYAVTRRYAGERAAFFAVGISSLAAFTLVRARVGLSFSFFALEWLFLVWSREKAQKPWAWVLWGAALGACLFDYEGWVAAAFLLLVLPFGPTLSARQRAWELVGVGAVLLALMPVEQFLRNLERRRSASFLQSSSPSAGWRGLLGLFMGGRALPYMAPDGVGVCTPWMAVLAGLGLRAWGRRAWVPLAYLVMGLAMPLMGGAPYGLPAHRFIIAWPVFAMLTGMGADAVLQRWPGPLGRWTLGAFLGLALVQQAWAWQASQNGMDLRYRAPSRDLKRAADSAWAQCQSQGLPLVTELHPIKGSVFRYLVGHPVPLVEGQPKTVVAFVPSEYLPAIRGKKLPLARFQEAPGSPPGVVAVLDGELAHLALEAEQALRPLMLAHPQNFLASGQVIRAWLRENPRAGRWARSMGVDYWSVAAWLNARFSHEDYVALTAEPLLTARPLLMVAPTVAESDPAAALTLLRAAHRIDPFNARIRELELGVLLRLGLQADAAALDEESARLAQEGALIWE